MNRSFVASFAMMIVMTGCAHDVRVDDPPIDHPAHVQAETAPAYAPSMLLERADPIMSTPPAVPPGGTHNEHTPPPPAPAPAPTPAPSSRGTSAHEHQSPGGNQP